MFQAIQNIATINVPRFCCLPGGPALTTRHTSDRATNFYVRHAVCCMRLIRPRRKAAATCYISIKRPWSAIGATNGSADCVPIRVCQRQRAAAVSADGQRRRHRAVSAASATPLRRGWRAKARHVPIQRAGRPVRPILPASRCASTSSAAACCRPTRAERTASPS